MIGDVVGGAGGVGVATDPPGTEKTTLNGSPAAVFPTAMRQILRYAPLFFGAFIGAMTFPARHDWRAGKTIILRPSAGPDRCIKTVLEVQGFAPALKISHPLRND